MKKQLSIYDSKTDTELKELPCMDWGHATGNLDNGCVPINPIYACYLIKLLESKIEKKGKNGYSNG